MWSIPGKPVRCVCRYVRLDNVLLACHGCLAVCLSSGEILEHSLVKLVRIYLFEKKTDFRYYTKRAIETSIRKDV